MKLLILIAYFIVLITIGFVCRQKATDVNGFVLGGRSVGPWLTAFAYGTSYFSAVVFVGYAGQFGWRFGIAATWAGIGNALIGSLLAWVILGRRTRIMTQHLDSATMPQFFGERFQSKSLKIAASVIIFIFLIPYTASLYNDPKATAETIKDGWLFTGDMAMQDEDGFYFLVDRKKDVIVSGGENIYPVQIENFLSAFDKVKDVAVIGLPDKRLGEITGAVISIKDGMECTEEEINEYCMKLPRYKRPKKLIFADVPRNATGKIEKPALRKKYGAEYLVAQQNRA